MRLRLDDVRRELGLSSNLALAEMLPDNPAAGRAYSPATTLEDVAGFLLANLSDVIDDRSNPEPARV